MEPKEFKKWRKNLKLSQKEAADVLGLKPRMVQYYEKGERDGKKVNIPKTVRLACNAILIQRIEKLDATILSDLTHTAHEKGLSPEGAIVTALRTYINNKTQP